MEADTILAAALAGLWSCSCLRLCVCDPLSQGISCAHLLLPLRMQIQPFGTCHSGLCSPAQRTSRVGGETNLQGCHLLKTTFFFASFSFPAPLLQHQTWIFKPADSVGHELLRGFLSPRVLRLQQSGCSEGFPNPNLQG